MDVATPVSGFKQGTGKHAEDANEVHDWKAAAGFLISALRPTSLVLIRIGHGEASAIGKLDVATVPEMGGGDAALQSLHQMGVDILHHIHGNFGPSLAVGAGVWTYRLSLLARELTTHVGHNFANRFAAGALRGLNLIKKAPESDVTGEYPLAAVGTAGLLTQQCLGEIEAKGFAELGERTTSRELGHCLRHRRNRGLPKEQRAEGLEERSCVTHPQNVYILALDSKDKMSTTVKKQPLTSAEIRHLNARYRTLASKLGNFGSLSQGSVMPQPPNAWRWTRKVRAKTVTRGLSASKAAQMKEAIDNQRTMDQIIDEMRLITQKLILESPENTPIPESGRRPKTSLT